MRVRLHASPALASPRAGAVSPDSGGVEPGVAPGPEPGLASLLARLPAELAQWLGALPDDRLAALEELRLRSGRPVQLVFHDGEAFLGPQGLVPGPRQAPPLTPELLRRSWQALCEASVYSWEDETRQGFLTLPGGHRVGVAGRFLAEDGRILRLRDVGGLNVRIARDRPGCADAVLPGLLRGGGLPHVLVFGPPGCGKTTLLRDLVRQLSQGRPDLGLPGMRVVLVDERGELAACHEGIPQRDVGPRTDVLDRCPKAEGIQLALRALNPQVVAFDELGGEADARAVLEAAYAGVRVLTTVHAAALEEAARRPALAGLFQPPLFGAWVGLGRRGGRPGALVCLGGVPDGARGA